MPQAICCTGCKPHALPHCPPPTLHWCPCTYHTTPPTVCWVTLHCTSLAPLCHRASQSPQSPMITDSLSPVDQTAPIPPPPETGAGSGSWTREGTLGDCGVSSNRAMRREVLRCHKLTLWGLHGAHRPPVGQLVSRGQTLLTSQASLSGFKRRVKKPPTTVFSEAPEGAILIRIPRHNAM